MRSWSKFDDTSKIDSVKIKLRSYRTLVSKYAACVDLFDRLYPSITQQFNSDVIQRGNDNSNETKTHALIDMRAQMADSLSAMQSEISEILELIKTLPPDEYVVIMRRYTLNESMEAISEKTFISIAQCWRMHGSAIKRIAGNMIVNDSNNP